MLISLLLAGFALAHAPALNAAQSAQLIRTRSLCARGVHCLLAQETTEGPYYISHPLIRSNITGDRTGIPFTLDITLLDVGSCAPVAGAFVDIWHADAEGEYSGWASMAAPVETWGTPVEPSRWLRGVQVSDAGGRVHFATVWPGWYAGRATHIHLRVHNGNVSTDHGVLLGGGTVSHTGQLFFADELVRNVSRTYEPYATRRRSLKPTLNGDDGIFVHEGGAEQIVTVRQLDGRFVGSVTVGIDPLADHEPWHPHPETHLKVAVIGIAVCMVLAYIVRKVMLRRVEVRRERAGYGTI
ncbi:aromatic compound dioxygenase [Trichodelitschia bisporula]|uniref:Aromatic compound dioxygenase n=1 Tax=Trichodelitschia bisporula TaxID=703511 RepID=A0A6G1HN18_9PEZI|nr:aromatic compound dioxygenase [Trichodelitschia bisporula]